MAVDENLTQLVRIALAGTDVREVKMFGGVGFMVDGHLVASTSKRGLLVRVGDAGKAQAFADGARPMVMGGREMKGFVRIDGELDAAIVKAWLDRARDAPSRLR